MSETGSIDRPPGAKPVSRPRSAKAATVSASALALHLDCSRTYVGKLEAEGVVQRQGGGFPLDQSRIAYLRHLRRAHRRSPRAEADSAHVAVKTGMLQLQLTVKKRELVRRADVDEIIDGIAGVTLTALSSLPARCAPRGDLAVRRSIERVVFEVRTEIANVCLEMADKWGEPGTTHDDRCRDDRRGPPKIGGADRIAAKSAALQREARGKGAEPKPSRRNAQPRRAGERARLPSG
jgi:hypothetical protein